MRQVKARGEPKEDDVSIAAHLLRLRDPVTEQPLPDELLAGEFGVFFAAGIESAGNAISWTLCATLFPKYHEASQEHHFKRLLKGPMCSRGNMAEPGVLVGNTYRQALRRPACSHLDGARQLLQQQQHSLLAHPSVTLS